MTITTVVTEETTTRALNREVADITRGLVNPDDKQTQTSPPPVTQDKEAQVIGVSYISLTA